MKRLISPPPPLPGKGWGRGFKSYLEIHIKEQSIVAKYKTLLMLC